MPIKKKCKAKGCNNPVISFSDKCGGHTSNKKVIAALKKYKRKKFKNLYLHELDLTKINFEKKVFSNARFGEISFEEMIFEDCSFEGLHCFNSTFSSCRFLRCTLSECDFQDVTFGDCIFKDCEFKSTSFVEGAFHDDTFITDTTFTKGLFIGVFIYDVKEFKNVRITETKFNQASINRSNFNNCVMETCEFSKMTWYDSKIIESKWKGIVHDFETTGSPKLCDFTSTKFERTKIPGQMRIWNLFKGSREKFFLKTIDRIETYKHPNYLPELTVCLERLSESGFKPDFFFANKIINIFRRQLQLAGQKGDYRTAGEVIGEYGRIPVPYRISGFTLPAPQKDHEPIHSFSSCLYLQFEMKKWTIENISSLYAYCNNITKLLPPGNISIEVSDVLKGSFFQTLWGDIRQLLVFGRLLDLEKLEIQIEDKRLEKELREIELIKRQALLLTEIKEKKLNLKKTELENKKLKLEIEKETLEIFERKLKTIEFLQEKLGLSYEEYIKSELGVAAAQQASDLRKKFPLLSLRLTVLHVDEER